MTFATTTLAALSIAAVVAAAASINGQALGTLRPNDAISSNDAISTSAKPAQLILAQRRGKCTEDLGYGRTGSYGCG